MNYFIFNRHGIVRMNNIKEKTFLILEYNGITLTPCLTENRQTTIFLRYDVR